MNDTAKLVDRVLTGDIQAWRELQLEVEPLIVRIARRHGSLRRKGLAQLPDDIAEIRTATLESLAKSNFQSLRRFVERQNSAGAAHGNAESFQSWVYGLVDFVVREHLRKRFGRASTAVKRPDQPSPSKRDLHSRAERLASVPESALACAFGITSRLTAREILEYIEREFAPEEARAARWYYLEDCGFDEIARRLGLGDAHSAERLVRRLNARLRYRFNDDDAAIAGAGLDTQPGR